MGWEGAGRPHPEKRGERTEVGTSVSCPFHSADSTDNKAVLFTQDCKAWWVNPGVCPGMSLILRLPPRERSVGLREPPEQQR